MAPDNKQMKESMPIKQKLTLGIMLIVVIAILWQLKGIFWSGGSAPSPTPAPAAQPQANQPKSGSGQQMSAAPPGSSMNVPATNPASAPQQPTLTQLPIMTTTPASLPSNDDQEEDQKKYLGKVDELQTLKLQRQIAETNQAIAAARLATVTAEKGITDLLTSSKSQPANVPQIVYSNQLENPSNVPSSLPAVTPTPAPAEPEVEYSVISVAMQLHQWSAILGYQGKLYNVTVGDTLPPDNSKVTQITSSHVTLRKDGKSRKVSVLSSI